MGFLIGLLALFVYVSISFSPQKENRVPQVVRSHGKKNGEKTWFVFFCIY